jgi:chromosome segregation ATPase
MYEREIRIIKNNADSTADENRRLEVQYQKTWQQLNQLQMQFNTEKSQLEQEITSKAQEVKLKAFEADRMKFVYEDTVGKLKESQIVNEKLTQKIDILTQELHLLQTYADVKVADISHQNYRRKQKLETLGAEKVYVRSKSPVGIERMRMVIDDYKREIDKLCLEIRLLEELLSKTKEPITTMIRQVRDSEQKATDAAAKTVKLEQRLKQLEEERRELHEEKAILARDLKLVLSNREEIDKIRGILSNVLPEKQTTWRRKPTPSIKLYKPSSNR